MVIPRGFQNLLDTRIVVVAAAAVQDSTTTRRPGATDAVQEWGQRRTIPISVARSRICNRFSTFHRRLMWRMSALTVPSA